MSSYTTASTASAATAAGLLYGVAAAGGEVAQFTLGGLQDINMVHMELLHHFITDKMMISAYPELAGELIQTASVQHAMREPYLMYQILSVAARHLCFMRPESTAFYQTQAIHLQARAINLFNSLDMGYLQRSRSNLVSVYLMSSLVGFQSLCEVLSHRDHDFSATLERFLTYLRLHRGVDRVLDGHRHELAESEISPVVLEMRGRVGRRQCFGASTVSQASGLSGGGGGSSHSHGCDELRRRILLAPDLGDAALGQILEAIDLLQFVISEGESVAASRSHILLSWPVLVGDAFVELVEAGRPEALAVLGYYFLALHYCRDIWMFCGSGHYLLTLLSSYVGHKWADWVATPYRLLRESLEREDADNLVEIEAAAGLFLAGSSSSGAVTEHSRSVVQSTYSHSHPTAAAAAPAAAATPGQVGPPGYGHGHGHGHGQLSYWKQ